eukprot:SM000126S26290  [mRNA]  locus=s126:62031:63543:+ [translate_table: standard]
MGGGGAVVAAAVAAPERRPPRAPAPRGGGTPLEGQPPAARSAGVVVRQATVHSHLLAAASLRAASFYTYPPSSSRFSAERHRTMKEEEECASLTAKVAGEQLGFGRVACLLALLSSDELGLPMPALEDVLQITAMNGLRAWSVGTLDLNLGLVLPGEELVGSRPQGVEAALHRTYLSNVCVAKSARRRGVGVALIHEAKALASSWGASDMYVHVVADNLPARLLYERCGFAIEEEESASTARLLMRPRRLLLHTEIDSRQSSIASNPHIQSAVN